MNDQGGTRGAMTTIASRGSQLFRYKFFLILLHVIMSRVFECNRLEVRCFWRKDAAPLVSENGGDWEYGAMRPWAILRAAAS